MTSWLSIKTGVKYNNIASIFVATNVWAWAYIDFVH